MKKLLYFTSIFVVHFAISLLTNWIFSASQNIVSILISSLLFAVIFPVVADYIGKKKEN